MLCAYGKNSGYDISEEFSNEIGSEKSSSGFFKTLHPYQGKHGYSLRLEGLEMGVNNNAFKRDIVIHGADYVCKEAIKLNNPPRLGRSQGCPAIPVNMVEKLISKIKEGSMVFIYKKTLPKLK